MAAVVTIEKSVAVAAARVVRAIEGGDKAIAKMRDAVNAAFQYIVDAAILAGVSKDKDGLNAMMKEIREASAFQNAVAAGLLEKKTITEYAQSAGRAFYWGLEFTPDLKNKTELKFPWTVKEGDKITNGATGKTGKVESTSRADLDKTLSKALKQMRMLGLAGLAAEVLDTLVESLEGFKEIEA